MSGQHADHVTRTLESPRPRQSGDSASPVSARRTALTRLGDQDKIGFLAAAPRRSRRRCAVCSEGQERRERERRHAHLDRRRRNVIRPSEGPGDQGTETKGQTAKGGFDNDSSITCLRCALWSPDSSSRCFRFALNREPGRVSIKSIRAAGPRQRRPNRPTVQDWALFLDCLGRAGNKGLMTE